MNKASPNSRVRPVSQLILVEKDLGNARVNASSKIEKPIYQLPRLEFTLFHGFYAAEGETIAPAKIVSPGDTSPELPRY